MQQFAALELAVKEGTLDKGTLLAKKKAYVDAKSIKVMAVVHIIGPKTRTMRSIRAMAIRAYVKA